MKISFEKFQNSVVNAYRSKSGQEESKSLTKLTQDKHLTFACLVILSLAIPPVLPIHAQTIQNSPTTPKFCYLLTQTEKDIKSSQYHVETLSCEDKRLSLDNINDLEKSPYKTYLVFSGKEYLNNFIREMKDNKEKHLSFD